MDRIATRSSRDFPLLFADPFAVNPPGLRIILPFPIGRASPKIQIEKKNRKYHISNIQYKH